MDIIAPGFYRLFYFFNQSHFLIGVTWFAVTVWWSDVVRPIERALCGHMYTGLIQWSALGLTNGQSVDMYVVTHFICKFSNHAKEPVL